MTGINIFFGLVTGVCIILFLFMLAIGPDE